jgi:hypothetical protein
MDPRQSVMTAAGKLPLPPPCTPETCWVGVFHYVLSRNEWTPLTGQWIFVTNQTAWNAAEAKFQALQKNDPDILIGFYAWDGQNMMFVGPE